MTTPKTALTLCSLASDTECEMRRGTGVEKNVKTKKKKLPAWQLGVGDGVLALGENRHLGKTTSFAAGMAAGAYKPSIADHVPRYGSNQMDSGVLPDQLGSLGWPFV